MKDLGFETLIVLLTMCAKTDWGRYSRCWACGLEGRGATVGSLQLASDGSGTTNKTEL